MSILGHKSCFLFLGLQILQAVIVNLLEAKLHHYYGILFNCFVFSIYAMYEMSILNASKSYKNESCFTR